MFFFRHPKPVVDGRAVAVQVVQQDVRTQAATVLIASDSKPQAPGVPAPGETDTPIKDQ